MPVKQFLTLFLFFLPVGLLMAQNNFQPGYVVLNDGDTLYGEVCDRNINQGEIFQRIKFKPNKGRKRRYGPNNLMSYQVGGVVFESRWYAEQTQFLRFNHFNRYGMGEKVFLRVLVKGNVPCYTMEFEDPDNDFIDGFELFLKEGDDFYQRANQGIFGLKKKRLSEYFQDCPDLVAKLNRGEFQNASEVARFYNQFCP